MGSERLLQMTHKAFLLLLGGHVLLYPGGMLSGRFDGFSQKCGTLNRNQVWNGRVHLRRDPTCAYLSVILLLCLVSGWSKGVRTAGGFGFCARGCWGVCSSGRVHADPCSQSSEWCHALLHRAWYVPNCHKKNINTGHFFLKSYQLNVWTLLKLWDSNG